VAVETDESGLWIRPPFAGAHAAEVRNRPWNPPQRLAVVVGLPGVAPGDDVLPLLHALLPGCRAGWRSVEILPRQLARRWYSARRHTGTVPTWH